MSTTVIGALALAVVSLALGLAIRRDRARPVDVAWGPRIAHPVRKCVASLLFFLPLLAVALVLGEIGTDYPLLWLAALGLCAYAAYSLWWRGIVQRLDHGAEIPLQWGDRGPR